MAIVSNEGIQREVPHEPGSFFEFKKLPWIEVDQAREIQAKKSRQAARDFGVEILKGLASDDDDEREGAKRAMDSLRYDASQYDTATLLRAGIVDWSYEEPVNADNIDRLDEKTAMWAAQEIIDLTRPPSEEEQGKD